MLRGGGFFSLLGLDGMVFFFPSVFARVCFCILGGIRYVGMLWPW